MKKRLRVLTVAMAIITLVSAGHSQTQNQTDAKTKKSKGGGPVTIQAGPPLVQGSGTIGQIPKWTNFTGINFVLGDSAITESGGNIGIGTTTPGSKLSVLGMIETTLGGYKFPDGTIQTTAAASGLQSVFHDATLQGDGTSGSPLGVKAPLILSGSVLQDGVIKATNTSEFGPGVVARGSNSDTGFGGDGVSGFGGNGVQGGNGIIGVGGNGSSAFGGVGVIASGGRSDTKNGGIGMSATGGASRSKSGGIGIDVSGGNAFENGNKGGIGIRARGGEGISGATTGLAGSFIGDVAISGNLSKGGGSFKIDHPLDPENKYLYHSFVESPDMMNIYNGNVTLDSKGEAIVEMPDYFAALNSDFRYLLTAVGAPMPGLYIGEEVASNRFKISGGMAGMKVSWQVTGIRQDAWANKNRIKVEELKSGKERGRYLHPEAFDQPDDRGVQFVRLAPQIERMNSAVERARQQPQQR